MKNYFYSMTNWAKALWAAGMITCGAFVNVHQVVAQNDVMMQAFYWNVPVDTANKNGNWYLFSFIW